MQRKIIGLTLVILGTILFVACVTKAYGQFMTYTYTIKYTCFGRCEVQVDADDSVHKYINYEELQVENERNRRVVELTRKAS